MPTKKLHSSWNFGDFGRAIKIYGIANLISQASGFVTFPLISRKLGNDSFGSFDYTITIIAFLTTIAIFGIDSSLSRFNLDQGDVNGRRKLLNTCLFLVSCFALLETGIFTLLRNFFPNLIGSSDHSINVLIFFLMVWGGSINHICLTYYRYNDLEKNYLVSIFLQTILILSNVYYWFHFSDNEKTAHNYLATYSVILAFMAVYNCAKAKVSLRCEITLLRIKKIITYAYPIALSSVLAFSLDPIYRSYIKLNISEMVLGMFAVAVKIGTVLVFCGKTLNLAYGPIMFKAFQQTEFSSLKRKLDFNFNFILFAVFLGLNFFCENLIHILAGNQFLNAKQMAYTVFYGLFLKSVTSRMVILFDLHKITKFHLVNFSVKFLFGLITIVMFPSDIFVNKVEGAVIASEWSSCLCSVLILKSNRKITFNLKNDAFFLASSSVTYILFRF